jgi:DNA mismatch repair protein MutL
METRKFFQIKNKYVVCPVKSGLMLIDQKRAHERILYERFLENLNSNRSISQTELYPVTIELNPADIFVLKEIEDDIRLLGFNFQLSDNNVISITGRPSEIGSADPVLLLEILLEEFKKTQSIRTGIREKVLQPWQGHQQYLTEKLLKTKWRIFLILSLHARP